ncbi:MAG: hypothetical protein NTW20_11195 [Rhodobacterales bacterium]|nr:hypothetical protein [Rhodobacterales bacterium]
MTKANEVTRANVSRLFAGQIKKGLKENARRPLHRVLSGSFGGMVQRGIIAASPVLATAPTPRVQRKGVPSGAWVFAQRLDTKWPDRGGLQGDGGSVPGPRSALNPVA